MDKLKKIIDRIKPLNRDLIEETQYWLNSLTKPPGSLGRMEEIARQIVVIKQGTNLTLSRKVIFTLAADHGIVSEGVSAYPQEVTYQMVENFLRGGAAINVLARAIGARLIIADLGIVKSPPPHSDLINKRIGPGTKNMLRGPAMTRDQAMESIRAGIDLVENEVKKEEIDIMGTGEMGIGNTTASSAITALVTSSPVEQVTGRGTGIDNLQLKRKIALIRKIIQSNLPDSRDPVDILSKVGGFEIGGLVGCILTGAAYGIPVVLDGFISTAAALISSQIAPRVKDYLIASHCSAEKGHRIALKYLGLKSLLNLNMRLGEGTGAALGINLADLSLRLLQEMATFDKAGVSTRRDL